MGFNTGISANVTLPPGNKSGGVENLQQTLSGIKGGMKVGRVTDIILNGNYPDIKKYGGLNGIGTIFFELNNFTSDSRGTAKPFFPQVSAFPLVNEMVLIFKLPSTNIGKNTSEEAFYYINMISLWNHPHHNAYPNPNKKEDFPLSQQKDYEQTEAGSVRRVTDQSTGIDLNSTNNLSQKTFPDQKNELTNIHPLLPFAGDIIYQGRFGNSIRFGSTARPHPPFMALNDWSYAGINGNPITIIRNGQSPKSSDEGWVPITEKINSDLSSIYLTSNQKIPIEVKNSSYGSYSKNSPTKSELFTQPQVIINSDRLVFNAKKDHVLISAQKSIFLGANSSLNFSTKECIIDSPSIKLGNGASESLILGDKFLDDFKEILLQLEKVCVGLKNINLYPIDSVGGVNKPQSVPGLNKVVDDLQGMLLGNGEGFIDIIDSYKSNTTKTAE